MLRIISAKLAQQTSGDLSIPGTNQQVLQPYKTVSDFVRNKWRERQQNKARAQYGKYERNRNPANGTCPSCGKYNSRDQQGRTFCPTCPAPKSR